MNIQSPSPMMEPELQLTGAVPNWAEAATQRVDPRRFILAFRRRLRLFGAVALAVFLATLIITLTSAPKYTAVASVMLDPQKERVTNSQAVLSDLPPDSSVVDTEVEVLKSRQLAGRVVDALRLDQDPEFNSRLRKPAGIHVRTGAIKTFLVAAKPPQVPNTPGALARQHDSVVDTVLHGLAVKRSGLTYVINVSYESSSPDKSAMIANKWAELYLLEQLEAKFEATKAASTWLNGRLSDLKNQVMQDEAAVEQYKIANNLLSAAGTNLTEAEISSYNQSLAQAQAQVAEDQARLSTARSQLAKGSNGDDLGEALNSPVIAQLRAQRAEVSRTVADLQGRYGDRHPEMLKAKRQLQDIDGQIQAEIQRIISNLEAKVQVSKQRAAAIQASVGGAKGTLEANNRATVRLNELQRTADASRTLYESYLNRFKETSTQEGMETSDARIVSKAKVPTSPSSPKINLNLAIGLMLAMAAGLGAITIAEMLDAGLTTAEDVERRLDTSYLGAVPLLGSVMTETNISPMDVVVSKPLSSFSEALRNLRASIAYSRLGEPVKVVVITSALPGEGKTTTAVCLARAAALQGSRTVVVDCDLRRRTVNRLLRADPTVGLLEALSGEATLQQALNLDEESGCYVLPLSKSTFTPKDVFGTAAMDRLLSELRARFDLVILDTAPVLPVADTRILAPKADAVVFLARWRKTPQHAIESALRLFANTGAHLGGVALTQVDMKQQVKYGYGDPGYYYAEYKKYYTA